MISHRVSLDLTKVRLPVAATTLVWHLKTNMINLTTKKSRRLPKKLDWNKINSSNLKRKKRQMMF